MLREIRYHPSEALHPLKLYFFRYVGISERLMDHLQVLTLHSKVRLGRKWKESVQVGDRSEKNFSGLEGHLEIVSLYRFFSSY